MPDEKQKAKGIWWDKSWNPIHGCTPVSSGCSRCWAKRETGRFYPDKDFSKIEWNEKALEIPSRWASPQIIFTCGMTDFFHPDVTPRMRALTFSAMCSQRLVCRKRSKDHEHTGECFQGPGHRYFILTKRPDRIGMCISEMERYMDESMPGDDPANQRREFGDWPPDNVYIGTSIENQDVAYRIDHLVAFGMMMNWPNLFISFEPLIGRTSVTTLLMGTAFGMNGFTHRIRWAQIGAETGPARRWMKPQWAKDLIGEMRMFGIPVFFKKTTGGKHDLDGEVYEEQPSRSAYDREAMALMKSIKGGP